MVILVGFRLKSRYVEDNTFFAKYNSGLVMFFDPAVQQCLKMWFEAGDK